MNALDVANFFVELANAEEDGCMTNLKLNRLVYFAQAWSLEKFSRPLFEEEAEAWQYGPVVPSVYRAFSLCGRNRISGTTSDYDESKISSEEMNLLLDVADKYWGYSAYGLRNLTHKKDGAWSQVYSEGRVNKIPKDLIRKDVENDHLDSFCDKMDAITSNLPAEGRHDKDGHLILSVDTYPDWDEY